MENKNLTDQKLFVRNLEDTIIFLNNEEAYKLNNNKQRRC